MVVTATATLAPTCEARTGFAPGEFSELPLWCSTRIGLTIWTDSRGQTHRACRHHVDGLQHRNPPRYVSEIADDGLGQSKAREDAVELGTLTFDGPTR